MDVHTFGLRVNVMKQIYRFSCYARVFFLEFLEKLTNDKHPNLVQKSVISRQKSVITLCPGLISNLSFGLENLGAYSQHFIFA